MASTKRPAEEFFFDTSDDEEVRDAHDSTSIDDSYLAHLSERMSKESGGPPPVGKGKSPPSGAGKPVGAALPSSFLPNFDEDMSNPLRVDPLPPQRPAAAPQEEMGDVMELGDDALESMNESVEPLEPPRGPAVLAGSPSYPPAFQPAPSYPPPAGSPSYPPPGMSRPSQIPPGPSDLLRTVPPPPEDLEPLDPELNPATYEAPTFVRPSLIDQDPVPVVEILQGNEAGRSYRFEKDNITIGRSLDNDIVLTDIAVSRRHMRLTRQGNDCVVEDLGSGNGTVVNGNRMPRSPLGSADRIEVGNTIIRIVFPGQSSFPANPLSLGPGANPQSSSPLHHKSTAYLGQGNQVLQQIGVAPQPSHHAAATLAPEQLGISPSAPPGFRSTEPPQAMHTPSASIQVAPQQAPPAQAELSQRSSPRSFKLAMAILAVGMLVIGSAAIIAAVIHVRNRNAPTTAGPASMDQMSAEELFDLGTKAFVDRRWGQASDAFERVLETASSNTKAREYLDQARAEERNQGTLAAAKQAFQDENYAAAVETLKLIPRQSVYSTEALELSTQAGEQQGRREVEQARLVLATDRERAREHLRAALEFAPGLSEALELRRELEGEGPATSPSEPGTPEPVKTGPPVVALAPPRPPVESGGERPIRPTAPVGGNTTKTAPIAERPTKTTGGASGSAAYNSVLALYKASNFTGAIARADEIAANASTEDDRSKARSLSRKIALFAEAWRGVQSAGNSRQKMANLETALRYDQQISSGHFANQIRPKLRDEYVDNAQRAWRAGQYASACQSALRAIKLDSAATGANQVAQHCESKAQEFYNQGESLRRTDINGAKGYWRKVLNMVPRSNVWYTKAYSALNNSGRRRYQDEDE